MSGEAVMTHEFSYEKITVSMVDAILADMRSQPVPLSNMASHYRAVQMFECVRWAKQAEQARREGA